MPLGSKLDLPTEFGRDRFINHGVDAEQTNGRTNPNYSMILMDVKNCHFTYLEIINFCFSVFFYSSKVRKAGQQSSKLSLESNPNNNIRKTNIFSFMIKVKIELNV